MSSDRIDVYKYVYLFFKQGESCGKKVNIYTTSISEIDSYWGFLGSFVDYDFYDYIARCDLKGD